MELSAADRTAFHERGIISLQGLVPKKQCAAVKAHINSELERAGLREKGKAAKLQSLPVFQQTGRLAQLVQAGPGLEALFTPELLEIMGSLAGARLKHAQPQLLLSLPHKEEWSLTRLNWHLDLAIPPRDEIPGVQAFVLIDDLDPRGGATLALAGSHRLPYLQENKSRSAHGILREHPVLRALYDGPIDKPEPFFHPQSVHGIGVSVVEMYGRAGDVFLMDLRVLHAPSINATKRIRMMATNRFLR